MTMDNDEYQHIAPHYERLFSRQLLKLRQNICAFIHHSQHKKIIDICCGTGFQLKMLDSSDMDLVGVDQSSAMLSHAYTSKQIRYVQANAAEINFPEKSFDAALICLALHEKRDFDKDILLKKAYGLVREGGHLIIADFCQIPGSIAGYVVGKFIIPIIEKMAGTTHYSNYTDWMSNGALEGALYQFGHRIDIISTHSFGTLMLCAINKEKPLEKAFIDLQRINFQFER